MEDWIEELNRESNKRHIEFCQSKIKSDEWMTVRLCALNFFVVLLNTSLALFSSEWSWALTAAPSLATILWLYASHRKLITRELREIALVRLTGNV